MTLTISLPVLIGLSLCLLLFIAVTVLAHSEGMFDDPGGYLAGLNGAFLVLLYAILWALPSLAGWAIYATWWR